MKTDQHNIGLLEAMARSDKEHGGRMLKRKNGGKM